MMKVNLPELKFIISAILSASFSELIVFPSMHIATTKESLSIFAEILFASSLSAACICESEGFSGRRNSSGWCQYPPDGSGPATALCGHGAAGYLAAVRYRAG